MRLQAITLQKAREYINTYHRHHKAPQGWKFGTSLVDDTGNIIGVVTIGRPVARKLDDGKTLEVTRLCTDGTKNACSKLYGAARRVAFDLGYDLIITYTLTTEEGASLRAAGWVLVGTTPGRSWSVPSRPRTDTHPTVPKYRWEARNQRNK